MDKLSAKSRVEVLKILKKYKVYASSGLVNDLTKALDEPFKKGIDYVECIKLFM